MFSECADCGECGELVSNNLFDSGLFQKLIGAGPGLTPSGDDFLCGVLIALHIHGFAEVAGALWSSIYAFALQSTTQVSFAMIEQSALGETGERLDALVRAYYDYPSTPACEFQRLIDLIGESSGWDWLTGFVLCSDILRQTRLNANNLYSEK